MDTMLYATWLLPLPEMLRKHELQFLSSLIQFKNDVIVYIHSLVHSSLGSSFFSSRNYFTVNCHSRVLSKQFIAQSIWKYIASSISQSCGGSNE